MDKLDTIMVSTPPRQGGSATFFHVTPAIHVVEILHHWATARVPPSHFSPSRGSWHPLSCQRHTLIERCGLCANISPLLFVYMNYHFLWTSLWLDLFYPEEVLLSVYQLVCTTGNLCSVSMDCTNPWWKIFGKESFVQNMYKLFSCHFTRNS